MYIYLQTGLDIIFYIFVSLVEKYFKLEGCEFYSVVERIRV